MSEVATRKDIDDVIGILKDFMIQVDQRFEAAEKEHDEFRQEQLELKQELVELKEDMLELKGEVIDLKESHNRLIISVDRLVGSIEKSEIEATARDAQYERLLAWAKKVSKKTGIPLDVN